MWRLPLVLVVAVTLLAPAPGSSGGPLESLAIVRGGDIWTVRADGTGARRLIENAYSPAWSPDGRRLAFVSGRSGDEEVYVARGDGRKAQRLTSSAGPDLSPSWSPDGDRLAWSRGGEIWTMSSSGSAQRRLVRKTEAWHENHSPTWGGDRIVFSSNRVSTFNPELYSVRAANGSGLRRLTRTQGSDRCPRR